MSSTSPKGGSGEKRPATGNMSEPELEAPPKLPKLDQDKSVIVVSKVQRANLTCDVIRKVTPFALSKL